MATALLPVLELAFSHAPTDTTGALLSYAAFFTPILSLPAS
ncbi:hypothetical protein [Collinsella sp. An2]|nr:hypothetical protein [Collinsella sp. An2]